MRMYQIFLSIIILACMASPAFAQYELLQSYYGAGGPVGTTGGAYELWGSALGQTAVTTIKNTTYEDQQGFYHGEKMFMVYFYARDVQRAAAGQADSITLWYSTDENNRNLVVVHYLYRGIWLNDTIGLAGDVIVAWVDTVQESDSNYYYEPISYFKCLPFVEYEDCDANYHRWARSDPAGGAVAHGDQDDPDTVVVNFYEQYRSHNKVVYIPSTGCPTTCDGGKVDYVKFKKFGGDSTRDDFYEHDEMAEIWADKGNPAYTSKFMFSDTTTGGFYTISPHVFSPWNKTTTNDVKYQKPYNAMFAASILWRRYTLFGVPLYPLEDTLAYREFASPPARTCITDAVPIDYGEQDIVLYDDLHTSCALPPPVPTDSNCGTWESWYRIMRYYPGLGSYLRYQGPISGGTFGVTKPHRFQPGYGFWGNQVHCDSIPIDVFGVMADTMESLEVPLGNYDGANNYSKYNMLANPFYDPDDNDTILVRAAKWRIKHYFSGGDSEYVPIRQAVASGWFEPAIRVYRRTPSGGWDYYPLFIDNNGYAGTDDDTIFEWEGFWIIGGATPTTDNLHLIMYVSSRAPVAFARSANPNEGSWYVQLSARPVNGDQYDTYNRAGFSRDSKKNCFEMPAFAYPPDIPSPMRLYFRSGDDELCNLFYSQESDIYTYPVVVEPGHYGEQNIVLYWDLSHLPPEYMAFMKIPEHGDVNLRTQSEVLLAPTHGKPLNLELFVCPISAPIASMQGNMPDKFFLTSAIPNPFNVSATVLFGVPANRGDIVRVEIIDQMGRKVRTLWDKSTAPGYYSVVWNGTDNAGSAVSAGVYFVRMTNSEFTDTKRAVLIK